MGRRSLVVDAGVDALARAALRWVADWRRNPFELPVRSGRGRPDKSRFLTRLRSLAVDARDSEPKIALSDRTVRRRATSEGWDEWWLLQRMRELALRDTTAGNAHRSNVFFSALMTAETTALLANVDASETLSGVPFPDELRAPIPIELWELAGLDQGLDPTYRTVPDSLRKGGLPRHGDMGQLTWAVSRTSREGSTGTSLAPTRNDIAWTLRAKLAEARRSSNYLDRVDPRAAHLTYWRGTAKQVQSQFNTIETLRLEILNWLIRNDMRLPRLSGSESDREAQRIDWLKLVHEVAITWQHPENRTSALREEYKELLRRGSYLFAFDGKSCQSVLPNELGDPFPFDAGRNAALALTGYLDELWGNGAESLSRTGRLAIDRWLGNSGFERLSSSATGTERLLAISHALQLLAVRAVVLPEFEPIVQALLQRPELADLDCTTAVDVEEWRRWRNISAAMSDAEAQASCTRSQRHLALAIAQIVGQSDHDEVVSPMVCPRNSAIVAAAHAIGQERKLSGAVRTSRARNDATGWAKPPAISSTHGFPNRGPLDVETYLRRMILNREAAHAESFIRVLVDAPGLIARLLPAALDAWAPRRREYERSFGDRAGPRAAADVVFIWSAMESLDFRAFTPRLQRMLLYEAVRDRSASILRLEVKRRQAPGQAVQRLVSAALALDRRYSGEAQLSDTQRVLLANAIVPLLHLSAECADAVMLQVQRRRLS